MVMATGTGKTRTAMALIDVLMRANWVKRVLFLADRRELLKQADNAFKQFLPNAPRTRVSSDNCPPDKRVYLSTYPAMHGIYPTISPGFFDLIIADESHRSIYKRYKEIFDHFDSYQIGLTATPIDYIERNTFTLFETDNGEPTYNYSYEEAVREKHLVTFKVLNIQSRFQMEGIRAGQLPVSVQKQLVAEGKDLEEIDFENTELEKKVTNSGTNEVIVREFMEQSIKDETGTTPGKSIIFAISHKHALRLEETFNRLYPEYRGLLARVIDSHDPRAATEGGLLDQFKDPKNPLKVAISVDMLDTGVDVPEVVNLVFAKPVFSRAKFWQMIGRGTRLCKNLFGPGQDKPYFLIIDHWNNFSYFSMNPDGKEPSVTVSIPEKLFDARLKRAEAALLNGNTEVLNKTIEELKSDIAALPKDSVVVKEKMVAVNETQEATFWAGFNAQTVQKLRKDIQPTMRVRSAEDFDAIRFDIDIIEFETALMTADSQVAEKIQERILEKVNELPLTLNQVRAKEATIVKIKTPKFWKGANFESLEAARLELRGLMKDRTRVPQDIEKLDIADQIIIRDTVEFGPEMERATTAEYRRKVEECVKALLATSAVLQKLKAGEELDEYDVEQLTKLLRSQDPYVTEELLQRVYDNHTAKFIDFICHILGLKKLQTRTEVISKEFDEFIAEHNDLKADQIQFLMLIKTFILDRGVIEREDLIGPPFTNIHPQGIRGIFPPNQLNAVMALIEEIGQLPR
ncbi:MAG: DEAD/DEAH box helicase family protein [Bdellovibrionaceae bacterium]|nr:DEAD/DEAH box helicase family protein [Pseudobdellovibrionaceae bacterium]